MPDFCSGATNRLGCFIEGFSLRRVHMRVLTGSYDNTARLWDAATGKEIRAFSGHEQPVLSVAFSPDGMRVLTGSYDKTARLWNAATGKQIRAFKGHEDVVTSVAFSPDGMRVNAGVILHRRAGAKMHHA